ncbi:leucyl aminopeptidase [Nocardioides nematodiphilus]|uniref:leucyl aminopeptidase n=1 Tax=Nocardioides nematodiphilus TaxID=2849669 RepID=UPI001CD930EB|nr:leucyl aminopeptidase [Nocardioides nematodiphilus]MCA1982018.1 leucyl aminopeptidase [Nocardioides nematodiphilus]
MTTYSLRSASPAKTRAEAVVVGVLQSPKGPVLAAGAEEVTAAYGRKARGLLAQLGVTGKAGEVVRVPAGDALSAQLLVLVGLGDAVSTDALRRGAGAAARAVPNATSVALALPADSPELVRAVTEGVILGGYTFTAYRSGDDSPAPADVILLSSAAKQAEIVTAFEEAQTLAAAVRTVRDWVNTPPADLTPPVFADAVLAAATEVQGVSATVFDEVALAEMGCGGILAVGSGSSAPPRLVELSYSPADPVAHLALVGKGITFDSGGLSIKPGSGMATMKSDMHGAASVVQATLVIAALGLPVRISTFVPMAENMISGAAMRPGDIITHYGGTTSEMLNADAEGRLILADALVRATEVAPDAIIDVATLTGAMVAALGDRITGVMGTDGTVEAILAAAKSAGEDAWPMPLPEIMTERVHSSKIADLSQYDAIRWGSGLFAGAFLREFTAGLPWAHLDIAGPSWNGGGAYGHITTGGTGTAVATLVDYARALAG